jgi:Putative glucoamylase
MRTRSTRRILLATPLVTLAAVAAAAAGPAALAVSPASSPAAQGARPAAQNPGPAAQNPGPAGRDSGPAARRDSGPAARTTGTAAARLSASDRRQLMRYAASTWKFFGTAVNPQTHLPMDNIGFDGAPQGPYTSPTDIGVYLWSVISAGDLGLISRAEEAGLARATLAEAGRLEKWDGFLLSWYSTTTGQAITGPGGPPITGLDGQFISTIDNAWYAAGLIETRQALPALAGQATALLNAMNFGVFYDNGDESTNVNAGQMYGGYTVGQGPATFEYGMLNSETRIAAYIGLGTGQMPGDVWWRTWRTEPAQFGQRQVPQGNQVTVTDPLSGRPFPVFEGHYSYGGISYVPSWGGDVFEALMPALVVPEARFAPDGFGGNAQDYLQATIAYDTRALGFGVWGLSPSSTPDDTGGYLAYGSWPLGTDASDTDYVQTAVTPHASFIALTALPRQALANIDRMLAAYPQILGPDGFYDALNPVTGSIGHRYLDLDQSMIMAALDDVLDHGALQQRWAADPIGQVDLRYLRAERFSVAPER